MQWAEADTLSHLLHCFITGLCIVWEYQEDINNNQRCKMSGRFSLVKGGRDFDSLQERHQRFPKLKALNYYLISHLSMCLDNVLIKAERCLMPC